MHAFPIVLIVHFREITGNVDGKLHMLFILYVYSNHQFSQYISKQLYRKCMFLHYNEEWFVIRGNCVQVIPI